MRQSDTAIHDEFQSRIATALRYALAIGATLVLLLPGARGFSDTVGWLPLWLLAMPAMALWALHGFPLPGRHATEAPATRRRRSGPQARRRVRTLARRALARAA
ncbi:hypothetical protein ACFPN1_09275 [Lysobacter yangpyeongensis]|uniref:DUF2892 domain-containing protein n=1 Tax=Lysobacter yangpyeongensis TaxID=346182 RepID=A0ABW0SMC1_9GAMM